MDLKEQLLLEISRRNADIIVHYIGNDPVLFKQLMGFVFNGEKPLPLRASWVASIISDTYPELLKPYLNNIITQLTKFEHPGVRRNLMRYVASVQIPEKYAGKLFDDCYTWLLSKDEPPAVKVYSMQILFNISHNEPDLLNELLLVLEELTDHESAAIRCRTRDILKEINKSLFFEPKTNQKK